jgi:predicted MFS family arabinose efflux permease
LSIGFLFLCGPLALKFIARFGERPVGMLSGLFAAVSIIVSSFAEDIWVLYVSYGVFWGIFGSCLLTSISLTLTTIFKNKLALGLGFMSSGASIGVLTIGPAFQALVDILGWRDALRVISGAVLLTGFLCVFFDPNVEEYNKQDSKLTQTKDSHIKMCCSLWRSPTYTIGAISIFMAFFGLYVPMLHLVGK